MTTRTRGQHTKCGQRETELVHSYNVTYETKKHLSVLFQCWGSVWPKVLPYCIFNVLLSMTLQYGIHHWGWVVNVTDKGHSYMTLIVAFLTVSRANVSMGRYNQAMGYISQMYCSADKLVQMAVIYSSEAISPEGAEWRHDVAYNTMLLLRSVMAVIDYSADGIPAWDLPEVEPDLAKSLKKQLFLDKYHMRWAHHSRVSENEENMRVPIRMSLMTKKVIRSARQRLPRGTIPTLHEVQLINILDEFMTNYYGIQKFLTTPFPFPLVQMARTFLFFYLFTVPFALLQDVSRPIAHLIVIFFLTYGFMGLEYVSIELDDPFGNDDNDFKNLQFAGQTFEDAYLTILAIDGPTWTDKLRLKLYDPENDVMPYEVQDWLRNIS